MVKDKLGTGEGAEFLILSDNSGDNRSPSLGSSASNAGAEKSTIDPSKVILDDLITEITNEDLGRFIR